MTAGVWSRVLDGVERLDGAALVTVVATAGSTPREAGARLVVRPDGRFSGTIGGGTLEWRAIALAQAALADARAPAFAIRSFALGPELGQCCGGRMDLAFEVFRGDRHGEVADLAAHEAAGPFATLGRPADRGLRRMMADAPAGSPAAHWQDCVLMERFGDDPRPVYLFGAGHVGRALVLALAPLPFAVTWVDPRPEAFPAFVPGNVRTVQIDPAEAVLHGAPDGAFVLAMTHSHALDLVVVHAALASRRFPYVGVIGSLTKRARFARQLRDAGVAEAAIAGMVCPIGLVGVRSKLPAVIAAGTAAELLVRDEAAREAAAPARAAESRAGTG